MYSPPLFDLMDLIFLVKLFLIKYWKTLKIPKTSYLCFMKYILQKLDQSSIKLRKYLQPLIDVLGIGPTTLLHIKSSIEPFLCTFPTHNSSMDAYLPSNQDILHLMFGLVESLQTFCHCGVSGDIWNWDAQISNAISY